MSGRWIVLFVLYVGCEGSPPVDVLDTDSDTTTDTVTTGDDDDTTTTGDDDDDDTTTPCAMEVTDPGTDASPGDWTSPQGNISPDRAWPVGVVQNANAAPFYIGTNLPNNEDQAFWSFRTGPQDFTIPLRVQNAMNEFESVHLHRGDDLCFGEEVPPVNQDIGDWFIQSMFPVEADTVYVLEVTVPGGGFF